MVPDAEKAKRLYNAVQGAAVEGCDATVLHRCYQRPLQKNNLY